MEHEEGSTLEFVWITIVAAVIAGLAASMAYYGFAKGFNPVCNATPISIEDIEAGRFEPGVEEIAPGIYRVNIVARQFSFEPSEIVLVDPKRVEFRVVSMDVIHGFQIPGTSVNSMVLPGYIGVFVWEPPEGIEGEFLILCNEYCGLGHDYMRAVVKISSSSSLLEG
ncbi:MAG: hypothetical protein F7C07_06690 [Desulfurococcales archaeon]|nr:hypothetical protein [Desulfurococcales archaeon]